MKTEDPIRAHFLMSPYNAREARRAREFKRTAIAAGLGIVTAILIIGFCLAFRG